MIELKKGKPFIVIPAAKSLPLVVEKLIAAVKAGELDSQIEARVKERRASKAA